MSEQIGHNCGFAVLFDPQKRDIVPDGLGMIRELQHRGQKAWGRAGIGLDDHQMWVRRSKGLIVDGMNDALRNDTRSSAVVIHTRYNTAGDQPNSSDDERSHPRIVRIPNSNDDIAVVHNGTVANIQNAINELKRADIHIDRPWDTEVIAQLLGLRISQMNGDVIQATKSILELQGAKNLGLLMQDSAYAFRDPQGFHPLFFAENDGKMAVASEDIAIRKVWGSRTQVRNMKPGELVHMTNAGPVFHQIAEPKEAHCAFEWIYFMNRLSSMDHVSVESLRYMLGEMLAEGDEELWKKNPLIVPVPESARVAAMGYQHASNQRYVDLMLARGGRSFIEDLQSRLNKVQNKYDIHPNLVRGQPIILLDDSIVRGTTLFSLIERIKNEAGPTEIHLRIACPPISGPCFYGIDLKGMDDLFVRSHFGSLLDGEGALPNHVLQAMARQLKVDSIKFVRVSDVPKALGIAFNKLCMACMTGQYPTDEGQKLFQLEFDSYQQKRTGQNAAI